MKIVIAPQSFKGSLSALQVAQAIEAGVKRIVPQSRTVLVPMADGGDGTVEALVDASGGRMMRATVKDPLGRPIEAPWGILSDGRTAVIEMASASGLRLLKREELNPRLATTYGTGQLIKAALEAGCRHFIIGIGGSATNDGGAGVFQALGARLLDKEGKELPFGGTALARLDRIDISGLDPRLAESTFRAACDVKNPLCGPEGASAIYGPQKGATPEIVEELDAALSHYADIMERDLGADVRHVPGAGAAGGLGAGLMAFLKAQLMPGFDIVSQATRVGEAMDGADLVFTGEGRIDGSTIYGKTPVGVAQLAKARGAKTIAIVGGVREDYPVVYEHGIDAVLSITWGPMTLDEASQNAATLVANAAESAMRLVRIGWEVKH